MRATVLHIVLPLMLLSFVQAGMPLQAQDLRETQVPIDAEGKVEHITAEQESQLHLFPDVRDFVLARLFQREDTSYVLEIESRVDGKISRARTALTQVETDALRRRVSDGIRARAPELALNQEGRSALITGTTTLSLAFYGWAVPGAIGAKGTAYGGMYFLISGGGFLFPYLATQRSEVTNSMATLALHGGARGIFDGFLLSWLMDGSTDFDAETFAALGTITSVGEMIGGYHIARVNKLSAGHAGVLSTVGAFGAGIGMASYGLLDASDEGPAGPLLGFGGSVIGYLVGNAMANNQEYTAGDAAVLTTTGLLGAFVPVLLIEGVSTIENPNVAYSSMILGSVAGLLIGHESVRGRNFSASQGNYIGLATTGGALMGLGFGMMFDAEDGKGIPIGTALGGVAGFLLMYNSFADQALTTPTTGGIHLSISPIGLAGLVTPSLRSTRVPLPLLNLSMRM